MARRTGAKAERMRTKEEAEGRRRPVESNGWRAEAQPQARKYVVDSGLRGTKVEPEEHGAQGLTVKPRESRAKVELMG